MVRIELQAHPQSSKHVTFLGSQRGFGEKKFEDEVGLRVELTLDYLKFGFILVVNVVHLSVNLKNA